MLAYITLGLAALAISGGLVASRAILSRLAVWGASAARSGQTAGRVRAIQLHADHRRPLDATPVFDGTFRKPWGW